MALTIGMINTLYGINLIRAMATQQVQLDFLYDMKFIIDDSLINGDYVGTVNLLRGKSDGSETFSITTNDDAAYAIDSATGVITIADATKISGADTMQIVVTGTLGDHTDNTATIDIQIYTIVNEYFVDTATGSDSNDGSEGNDWLTIDHAASTATAGDKVWIKAGAYGAEHVVFDNSGTSTLPIVVEGYKSTPGDITDHTESFVFDYTFGDSFDSAEMPLLHGATRLDGTGLNQDLRSYIILKNIQVQSYYVGINASSCTGMVWENILGTEFCFEQNGGSGMNAKGQNGSLMRNCIFSNATSSNITFQGDDSVIDYCESHCDETDGLDTASDYYFLLEGSDNKFFNLTANRHGALSHSGHGIGLTSTTQPITEGNLIKNCLATGLGEGYLFRQDGVRNNIMEDCEAFDNSSGSSLVIREGASYNTFRRMHVKNARRGIGMYNKDAEGINDYCGRYNTIENSIFDNITDCFLDFFYYEDNDALADYLTIVNCVVDGAAYMYNIDRENANINIINTVIANITDLTQSRDLSYKYSLSDVNYENCVFYNNGFDTPQGVNITEGEPKFTNIGTNDYTLTSLSNCLNNAVSIDKCGDNLLGVDGSNVHYGNFYSDIESWVDDGTTQLSYDAGITWGALKVTGNDVTTGGYIELANSANGDLFTNIAVGTDIKVSINAKVDTGDSVDIIVNDGSSDHSQTITSDEFATYDFDITIQSGTTPKITFANLASAEIIWVDWYIVREVTGQLPELDFYKNALYGTGDIGVYELQSASTKVAVTGVTVSSAGNVVVITVAEGTLQMSAVLTPASPTYTGVTWSIINGTGTATISGSGLVTAVTNGTVTVRARSEDGSWEYDDFVLTLSNQYSYTDKQTMGTGTHTEAQRQLMGIQITMPENGDISELIIYHDGAVNTGDEFNLGIYSDTGADHPDSLLRATATTVISDSAGWQTIALTSTLTVTSGTKIWLSVSCENNPGTSYGGTFNRATSTSTSYHDPLPATYSAHSINTSSGLALYAKYS